MRIKIPAIPTNFLKLDLQPKELQSAGSELSLIISKELKNYLFEFVETCQDGYGIFNSQDVLIYSNEKFSEVMCIPRPKIINMSFESIMRHTYSMKQGINIESNDINEWLIYAKQKRRSRKFRLFEVDFTDGRWFLFSEQTNDVGDMLVQIKDISKQKILEQNLASSVVNLKQLALIDELTKVANRRSFIDSVNSELNRCRRTGALMSLMIFDLDHFKNINDSYGHPVGDKALIHVTNLIEKSLRDYDLFGRIGGEEFAVFLSNTPPEKALEIAERIRKNIQSNPLCCENQKINLSTSIGLTTENSDVRFDKLYEDADQALYEAKQHGRNQVVVSSNN